MVFAASLKIEAKKDTKNAFDSTYFKLISLPSTTLGLKEADWRTDGQTNKNLGEISSKVRNCIFEKTAVDQSKRVDNISATAGLNVQKGNIQLFCYINSNQNVCNSLLTYTYNTL